MTISYFPSILITVAGNDNNKPVRKPPHPDSLYFVFTFIGTLQPLTLSGVESGHFVRLAGWPADADTIHGSDPEVVGVAHLQAVHRVFTNLHWGVVALDPAVAASFTPTNQSRRWHHLYNDITSKKISFFNFSSPTICFDSLLTYWIRMGVKCCLLFIWSM